MSVEVTRLPSGLTVVTDHMPHLETASLGVWVGSGSRDEKPDEHGISHLLEHMAFKGTTRRTARQIAEEIEAVGGDLNAATSVETHGLLRARAQGRRAAGARCPLRHSVRPDLRCRRTAARAECDRAGDRRRRGRRPTIWCSTVCRRPRFPTSRSAAPSSARRETVRSFNAGALRSLSRAQLPRARHGRGGGRRGRSRAIVAEVEQRFASFNGPAAPAPEPAHFRGGTRVETRDLEQVHIALGAARRAGQRRSAALQPAGFHQRARRRHVFAAVPGSAREARALLHDLRLPHALFRHGHVRALCRHRRDRRARTDARRDRPDRQRHRDAQRGRGRRAPRRR